MKTARTAGVVRAGVLMAVATLVSRLTGFLAKVVILSVLGFGVVNDAYTIANTLPNIVFELLIGGVLTSVAIPLLSRARSDPDGGEGYTQRLMTVAVVGLLAATALAIAAAPLLTRLYLSGGDGVVNHDLADSLAYLLLPQIFFYGIAALFGAILNTKEKFAVPAWAPVVNNLVVIGVGIALTLLPSGNDGTGGPLTDLTRSQFLLLALGTTAGIVMQALVMLPALRRSGFRWRWRWGGDPRLLEAGQLMLWAVVYVLISQAGYIVLTRVASDNVVGGVTTYSFASMLFQLPYGIIGVSILTAVMPRMSRHAAAGQIDEVKDDASLANRLSIVALTPVAAGIIVLAGALAIVVALRGRVSLTDTLVLGGTLAALAIGLVPFAVTLVQMRVFYAMKDARTPALINLIMVGVRIPLLVACATLDDRLVIPGMAIATSGSYLVGAIAGEIWLRARYGPMGTRRTLITLVKMIVAGAAGAGVTLLFVHWLISSDVDTAGEALLQICTGSVVGLLVISGVATALKVDELVPLRNRIVGVVRTRLLRRPGAAMVAATGAGAAPADRVAVNSAVDIPAGGGRGAGPPNTVVPQYLDRAADARLDQQAGRGPSERREQVFTSVPANARPPETGTPAAQAPDDPDADHPADGDLPTTVMPIGGHHEDPADSADPANSREHADQEDSEESLTTLLAAASDPASSAGSFGNQDSDPTARIAPALTPGLTVGGRYRLVSLVSADAAGHWFWRAKDTVLPRDMAVTMLPDTTGSSATVARTLRAGRLHHIGLPQTLDVGTDFGQSYVVGQWVDGATLTDLISGGPLQADVASSITAKLSEAVAEAHRNGIAFGALNPSLVRVNFDGQVRLSHVIAHASATPDHDIRAIGALLYLMLTGTWPLGDPINPRITAADAAPELPAAPTRLGRELPAIEVNPSVPNALSALAERALHPEESDGIHAVGAIAALLRSPETVAGTERAQPVEVARPLSAADRRLIKERRVKLSLAAVVLTVFALLIAIALGGLTNQFVASIQNSAPDELPMIDPNLTQSSSAAPSPTPDAGPPPAETTAPPSPTGPVPAPVKVVKGTVYDPQGDGKPDYKDYVDRAYDGNQDSAWLTWVYKQQFPTLKKGVGIMLELEKEVSPTSVFIQSSTAGTVIEVRSATSPTAGFDQTTVLASGTVTDGSATIPLTNAPKSKYLLLFVTKLTATPDNQFQGKINEVTVQGL